MEQGRRQQLSKGVRGDLLKKKSNSFKTIGKNGEKKVKNEDKIVEKLEKKGRKIKEKL